MQVLGPLRDFETATIFKMAILSAQAFDLEISSVAPNADDSPTYILSNKQKTGQGNNWREVSNNRKECAKCAYIDSSPLSYTVFHIS